jgi:hypothetical protein
MTLRHENLKSPSDESTRDIVLKLPRTGRDPQQLLYSTLLLREGVILSNSLASCCVTASLDRNADALTPAMITNASNAVYLIIVKERKEGMGRKITSGKINKINYEEISG